MSEVFGDDWNEALQTQFGDMNMTTSVNKTWTINATDKTQESSTIYTYTFSGGNITTDGVWDAVKTGWPESDAEANDAAHSITGTSDRAETISPEFSTDAAFIEAYGIQINQDGTKMKARERPGTEEEVITFSKQ
ncbi:MAG: hypothetical protein LBC88_08405 [Spirochaetaceae bacterium]|nr:hypothetical protein [Spirochaetaceae bacterium]